MRKPLIFLMLLVVLRGLSLLLYPLFWGVMDDAHWKRWLVESKSLPWAVQFSQFFHSEKGWGLFRPTYFLWAEGIYRLPPRAAYMICFVLYGLIGFGYGWLFKVWHERFLKQSRDPFAPQIYWLIFGLSFLTFFPALNFINLISLQEKLALFFAMLCFACFLFPSRQRGFIFDFFALFFWILALGAKISIFVQGLFALAILLTRPASFYRNCILILLGALTGAAVIFARAIAREGVYTSRYSLGLQSLFNGAQKYFKLGGPWAYVVLLVLVAWTATWIFRKTKRNAWHNAVWPVVLFLQMVVMLPWGLFGYYWSILTPWFAGTTALLASQLDRRLRTALVMVLILGTGMALGPKLHRLLMRPVATGKVVDWLRSEEAKNYSLIWMPEPCEEAAPSLEFFSNRPTSSIQMFKYSTVSLEKLKEPEGFLTWWECPKFRDELQKQLIEQRRWGEFVLWKKKVP